MAQPINNHYMLTNGGSPQQATSYVVEVSRLRYWVLNFNVSEAGLAGPNKGSMCWSMGRLHIG